MNKPVKFGLRIPAFPLNDSRGSDFRDEIVNFLAPLEGKFASVWLADTMSCGNTRLVSGHTSTVVIRP